MNLLSFLLFPAGEIIKHLFNRLADHFPSGEMAFDAHSRQLIRLMKRTAWIFRGTNASFQWGISKPEEIQEIEPRLEFITVFKTFELPDYGKMSFIARELVWIMDLFPAWRGIHRPLPYRFPRRAN